jgi:hypothetical protein
VVQNKPAHGHKMEKNKEIALLSKYMYKLLKDVCCQTFYPSLKNLYKELNKD